MKGSSLKGRITPAIAESITKLGSEGRGPREIARVVTKDHKLTPPLSHVSVIKFLERAVSLTRGPVKDEGLSASELLKREALTLAEVAGRFAAAGNGQAYLRSLGTLAVVLKTVESLAAADRKREGTKTGLADILTAAYTKDTEFRRSSPEAWLTVGIPRVLADMLEVADALAAIPVAKRAELGRPLAAALEALGVASSA